MRRDSNGTGLCEFYGIRQQVVGNLFYPVLISLRHVNIPVIVLEQQPLVIDYLRRTYCYSVKQYVQSERDIVRVSLASLSL